MGQKVNPIGLRLNLTKRWKSRWFGNKKDFAKFLMQDELIRKAIRKKFPEGAIKEVIIFRNTKAIDLTIHTAKPGIIIGRSGTGMNDIRIIVERNYILNENDKKLPKIKIHVEDLGAHENSAQLIGETVANQIQKRVTPRRAMKQALDKLKEKGVKGAKVRVSGRLGGADIARSEVSSYGSIPLHSIKMNIDYAHVISKTTYGTIGVKVWLNLGEFDFDREEELEEREREKRKNM